MSAPLGNYSFLPWLRLGLGTQIAGGDRGRAVIDVKLDLRGADVSGTGTRTGNVQNKVALFGPGDIQGVERRAIVRTEPHDWSTNFEPNYLVAIEFYDEDFPWRYTPSAADASGRLLPWLTLLVLEEKDSPSEFTDGKDATGKPLPYIEVPDTSRFPPSAQLWAWAHVHVNRSLAASDTEIVSTDMNAVLPKLKGLLDQNADLALSRILSPRKLDANKPYHAFLIPTFESGRRAGLGLDPYQPALPSPTAIAWETDPGRPLRIPYYHRWYFHTGGAGDFESLVRLLKPREVDYRVGRRDIDVQNPGFNVRSVDYGRTDLHGILKLGGALQVPDGALTVAQLAEKNKYEKWAEAAYPQPIQEDIARLVNVADDYAESTTIEANRRAQIKNPDGTPDPDPVVMPPLYGTWHAMAKRLLKKRDGAPVPNDRNWLHEINLDPRYRAAASFGARVVQEHQETYMQAAWEQLGDVLDANRRIRLGQAACAVTTAWYDKHLVTLMNASRQKGLQVAGPLNKRVVLDGQTLQQIYAESHITPTMTSGAMRRAMRPRGRLVRKIFKDVRLDEVFAVMDQGQVTPAPFPRPPGPAKKPFDPHTNGPRVLKQIDPQKTIPKRVKSAIRVPRRVRDEVGDGFVEAMAYPEIKTPMYEPLKNLSSELFLPNLSLIPDNSITLLESNQKFIEAYMVGLNHEFARELLWREYPTDQRGSYFRQFWDRSTHQTGGPDIPWLNWWPLTNPLGAHNVRGTAKELVLAIRGELLKRYPTAVIYAHRAEWQADRSQPRRRVAIGSSGDVLRMPLYSAKIDPDIYFFGFDLKVDDARGGSGVPGDDNPGWFFVLKERPGEPRFGLDIDRQATLNVWNDLSWPLVQPGAAGTFIEIKADQSFTLTDPGAGDKAEQYANDRNVAWGVGMSSADLAYILFQSPVLVAVHASEMLPPKRTP